MAKAKKSADKDKKKSPPKNILKDVIKQSVQPPPKAITLRKTLAEKKGNKRDN
jgi:hypothetical protein